MSEVFKSSAGRGDQENAGMDGAVFPISKKEL